MDSNLQVRIMSSKKDLFSGEAAAVSSVNSLGVFDVLPGHAKFVTVVENEPIVLRFTDKGEREFKFALAIVRVKDNKVDVFVNPSEVGQELGEMV